MEPQNIKPSPSTFSLRASTRGWVYRLFLILLCASVWGSLFHKRSSYPRPVGHDLSLAALNFHPQRPLSIAVAPKPVVVPAPAPVVKAPETVAKAPAPVKKVAKVRKAAKVAKVTKVTKKQPVRVVQQPVAKKEEAKSKAPVIDVKQDLAALHLLKEAAVASPAQPFTAVPAPVPMPVITLVSSEEARFDAFFEAGESADQGIDSVSPIDQAVEVAFAEPAGLTDSPEEPLAFPAQQDGWILADRDFPLEKPVLESIGEFQQNDFSEMKAMLESIRKETLALGEPTLAPAISVLEMPEPQLVLPVPAPKLAEKTVPNPDAVVVTPKPVKKTTELEKAVAEAKQEVTAPKEPELVVASPKAKDKEPQLTQAKPKEPELVAPKVPELVRPAAPTVTALTKPLIVPPAPKVDKKPIVDSTAPVVPITGPIVTAIVPEKKPEWKGTEPLTKVEAAKESSNTLAMTTHSVTGADEPTLVVPTDHPSAQAPRVIQSTEEGPTIILAKEATPPEPVRIPVAPVLAMPTAPIPQPSIGPTLVPKAVVPIPMGPTLATTKSEVAGPPLPPTANATPVMPPAVPKPPIVVLPPPVPLATTAARTVSEEGGEIYGTVVADDRAAKILADTKGHLELYLHPTNSRDPQDTIFVDYEFPSDAFEIDAHRLHGDYQLYAGVQIPNSPTAIAQVPCAMISAANYKAKVTCNVKGETIAALARNTQVTPTGKNGPQTVVLDVTLFNEFETDKGEKTSDYRAPKPIPGAEVSVVDFPDWGQFFNVRIVEPGDTKFALGQLVEQSEFEAENRRMLKSGHKPAFASSQKFGFFRSDASGDVRIAGVPTTSTLQLEVRARNIFDPRTGKHTNFYSTRRIVPVSDTNAYSAIYMIPEDTEKDISFFTGAPQRPRLGIIMGRTFDPKSRTPLAGENVDLAEMTENTKRVFINYLPDTKAEETYPTGLFSLTNVKAPFYHSVTRNEGHKYSQLLHVEEGMGYFIEFGQGGKKNLVGQLFDPFNGHVPRAKLHFIGDSKLSVATDNQGRFLFPDVDLPPGIITVEVDLETEYPRFLHSLRWNTRDRSVKRKLFVVDRELLEESAKGVARVTQRRDLGSILGGAEASFFASGNDCVRVSLDDEYGRPVNPEQGPFPMTGHFDKTKPLCLTAERPGFTYFNLRTGLYVEKLKDHHGRLLRTHLLHVGVDRVTIAVN